MTAKALNNPFETPSLRTARSTATTGELMSKKTDRRVNYTKRALRDALVELMHDNHISKISVKALCDVADVNRSTFYTHYRNQYDLLEHIEANVLEGLKACLLENDSRVNNVAKILEYAQANADLFLMLLDESDGGFQQQIMELAHIVDLKISDQQHPAEDDEQEYMYLFTVNGTLGALTQWLRKGTPQPPAQMAELLLRMVQSGIRESR